MTDIQKAMLGDKEAAERLTEMGEFLPCPWCKEEVFVYVHDDEGNAKGNLGCDYERDPWSGLSYGIHHFVEWGTCPLASGYYDDSVGGMLFDTAEEAIRYWNTRPQILTKEQIEALERMEEE